MNEYDKIRTPLKNGNISFLYYKQGYAHFVSIALRLAFAPKHYTKQTHTPKTSNLHGKNCEWDKLWVGLTANEPNCKWDKPRKGPTANGTMSFCLFYIFDKPRSCHATHVGDKYWCSQNDQTRKWYEVIDKKKSHYWNHNFVPRYEPDHNQNGNCRYNQNPGYVVFSAMGSFFLPMAVMVYVYARISCVVARRHQQLASSTKCSKVGIKITFIYFYQFVTFLYILIKKIHSKIK